MANKIELYREVLEIEPNSKVFFPLARELAEEGHVDAAVAALQKGIAFHPDHLEAKFLLIDILTRQGRESEAESVFTDVGALLARYPSVWLLWSKAAAARSRDPSLAMLFLGHYFQNGSLTWAEVMERGLRSLTQAASDSRPEAEAPSFAPVPSEAPEVAAIPEPAVASASVPSAQAPVVRDSVSESETESLHAATEPVSGVPPLRGAREVMELADLLEAPDSAAPPRSTVRTGKSRETPVCTRTMASLLASQGDIDGALEIYDALIESATGPERAALEAEAAALAPAPGAATGEVARPSSAAEASDAAAAVTPEDAPPQRGAAKLINLLEALAGRLEARSEA
jgi:tetratricopeptide (TPR) repeat protein